MICEPQPTEEANWQGRIVYVCPRPECGRRIAPRSRDLIGLMQCRDADHEPVEQQQRHDASSLPCIHRGEPTGDKVSCGCGARGVKIDVYRCAQFAICTVISPAKVTRIGRTKPAVCLGCEMRATS